MINEQIESVIDTIQNSDKELSLYEELAPIYEYLYADEYNFEKQASIVLNHTTEENATIVDLGCGTGELINLLSLKQEDGYYIGIDLSERLLNNARSQNENDNVEYITMDYRNIYSLEYSVDTYCSFGSLTSHTTPEEMEFIMNEVYDTLPEGGSLIIDYHSPVQKDGTWSDDDGMVVQWENETTEYIIKSTIITVNRGDKSHYTVAYEIIDKETGESYNCSQKIPIQFYTEEELGEKLTKVGFTDIKNLSESPDRSGTIVATK